MRSLNATKTLAAGEQNAARLPGIFRQFPRAWRQISFVGILLVIASVFGCKDKQEEAVSHPLPLPSPSYLEYSEIAFAIIPAGDYFAGSPSSEFERKAALEFERQVPIPYPFGLSIHEITRKQYWAIVDPARSVPPQEADLPMVLLTWQEAVAFCEKLNELHPGKQFRLPSEWEWEYACRAGERQMFSPWDSELADALERLRKHNDYKKLPRLLRNRFNFDSSGVKPVGTYPPNAWGLYDMHGNVAEWCALPNPHEPDDAPSLSHRALRGGAWTSSSCLDCRSANRAFQSGGMGTASIGFRVLLESP